MRVLLVDDHDQLRRGMHAFLSATDGIEICGEAGNGLDAVSRAVELKPELILMDIDMPFLNGIEATRQIKRLLPQIQVIVLTGSDTEEWSKAASDAGAAAIVPKTSSSMLLSAIERVQNGFGAVQGGEI